MSKWRQQSVDPPEGLDTVVDLISDGADAIVTVVEAVAAIATIISKFQVDIPDLESLALKTIIEQIKSTIERFINDSNVYYLTVPIRKQTIWDGAPIPSPIDVPIVGPLFDQVGEFTSLSDAKKAELEEDEEYKKFISKAAITDGGNAGFYRAVMDSIADPQDLNRPQFDEPTDWVAGGVAMIGATDLVSLLNAMVQLFKLFKPDKDKMPLQGIIPTPTGLTAVPLATSGSNTVRVFLNWDALDAAFFNLPGYSAGVLVERVCVIRSTNVSMMGKTQIDEILAEQPTEGLEEGDVKVVMEQEFDGVTTSYLDLEDLEKGVSYYYAVAYKGIVGTEGQDAKEVKSAGTHVDYQGMSNVVKVVYDTATPRVSSGTPPNWNKHVAVANVLPSVALFAKEVIAYLDQLLDATEGASSALSKYLKFLNKKIQRLADKVNAFVRAFEKLAKAFLTPETGLYFRTFVGEGGTPFFLSDLAQSLAGKTEGGSDPGAPPFNQGDEFVTGVILLAGGPSLSSVKDTLDVIELFFGEDSGAVSDLQVALDSIAESLAAGAEPVVEEEEDEPTFLNDAFEVIPEAESLDASPERKKCAGLSEETGNIILGDNLNAANV